MKEVEDYETVIGLEVHAHLKTHSKLFCSCPTEFGNAPNANTCPVCTGQPGVLPVLNKESVNMAILAGIAVNCKINKKSVFARKNYFYPDLPKAYQISQFEEPICSGGWVEIEVDGVSKKIKLNRIHMEEDAGKMVHVGAPGIWGSKASAVDYNRSSVPLIEIVTEPDISTAKEAKEYVIMLRAILVSLGICDGNLEEGSLRCDANISIRPRGTKTLGVKTEIKNMNSFKAIERAIDFEVERQKKLKKLGLPIEQETRLWDESSQKTFLMRSKEESHDYRYFPDPDLLPLTLTDELIDSLRKKVGESPLDKKRKYQKDYNLTEEESKLMMVNPEYANYFEETLKLYNNPKNIANWFFNEILSYITQEFDKFHITADDFASFLKKIDSNEISGKIGKSVIRKAFDNKKSLMEIIETEGVKQITDTKEIENLIDSILNANQDKVAEYKSGKVKLFGFFVGEIMKQSKGKANPQVVNDILKGKIG
ncbi:MAG: aspartyl/glutamyl-tRNA amidotransferase subunit B [Spirochaetes bacterium GWD1_27_9]|nr:MAG: aspartyl/glutamyl-tRNA amidotransferase subunit B [Spirochaetes bacterium GWB1_27_13]OHD28992.1 MAG: aspartyl/glutamyl-tRNA amidotransferase subunit B [Spirochaetes bacterium GWD1_27_9]